MALNKKSIEDIDVKGKKVLARDSLERLSIFNPTTCVRLWYGYFNDYV